MHSLGKTFPMHPRDTTCLCPARRGVQPRDTTIHEEVTKLAVGKTAPVEVNKRAGLLGIKMPILGLLTPHHGATFPYTERQK